jgi:hypothetical protein
MAKQGIQGSGKPALSTAIVNGELQHVLVVDGQPFERFSSLKQALCALALAISLTGCATVNDFAERHPRATAVIAGVAITSIALSTRGHSRESQMSEPLIATPSVDCSKVSCQ